jgi:hypothetical protein
MQTREDIFWLIVATLAMVGDYFLIRLAARDGRIGAWIGYGTLTLLWPPLVWLGTLIGWLMIYCGDGGCFS